MKNVMILIFLVCLMQFTSNKADIDKDAKQRADLKHIVVSAR